MVTLLPTLARNRLVESTPYLGSPFSREYKPHRMHCQSLDLSRELRRRCEHKYSARRLESGLACRN